MPVEIRNRSLNYATLPYPMRGMLEPGQSVVVNKTPQDLIDRIPGIGKTFGLRELPSYNGPYNSPYDIEDLEASAIVCIDGVLGMDANDGSDAQHAVASFARAAQMSPRFALGAVIYKVLSAGNYAYVECPTLFGPNGRWSIYCVAATRVGPSGSGAIATGTADTSTSALTIKGTFTTNQYQHCTVEMASGSASGYRRTVQQCSTTDMIPCRQFETADSTPVAVNAASGDTYSVYRPGVVITGFTGFSNKRVLMWDLAFASVTERPQIRNCDVYGWGVEFRGTVFPLFTGCTGSFGVAGNAGVTLRAGFSTGVTTFNLAWYADFEKPATAVTQAQQKGCGVAFPDINATVSTTTSVFFQSCVMTALGTWPAIGTGDGYLAFGGFVWGLCAFGAGTHVSIIGRANSTATVDSTILKHQLQVTGARLEIDVPVKWDNTPGSSACVLFDDAVVNFAAGSAGSVIDASTGLGSGILVDRRSHLGIFGALTFTSGAINANVNQGVTQGIFEVNEASMVDIRAALTVTNTGTRPLLQVNPGGTVRTNSAGSMTLTGSGGVNVEPGAVLALEGGACTTAGGQVTNNGGVIDISANLTIGTAPGIPLRSIGGQVTQRAGILSCVATAGDGLRAEAGARVRLRSSTNTVLTGAGTGNFGCRAKGGASVWFDGSPSSVSGPNALGVPGTSAAISALGSDDTFITDGAGTTIGRAA